MKDDLQRLSARCPAYSLQKDDSTLYGRRQRYELGQVCSWLLNKIMYLLKQNATGKLITLSPSYFKCHFLLTECKTVSLKAANLPSNPSLFSICSLSKS